MKPIFSLPFPYNEPWTKNLRHTPSAFPWIHPSGLLFIVLQTILPLSVIGHWITKCFIIIVFSVSLIVLLTFCLVKQSVFCFMLVSYLCLFSFDSPACWSSASVLWLLWVYWTGETACRSKVMGILSSLEYSCFRFICKLNCSKLSMINSPFSLASKLCLTNNELSGIFMLHHPVGAWILEISACFKNWF